MARDSSSHLLAHNLKRLRGLVGLSQAKLAERCDLSTNFISELEGKKVWVSSETLDRIAAALGVQTHSLFLPSDTQASEAEEVLLRCLQIFETRSKETIAEVRAEVAKATGGL